MERDSNCRELMFEKVVTPSDVGKLNRLVIPKQHAERHFPAPASASASAGSETTKGALLSFEDACTGRAWRFRYSYWGSSQSYVITKGWSRFVKDKGLLAGDTVSFARNHQLFFIDCRRQKQRTNIINYNCCYFNSCDKYKPLIRAFSSSFPPLQPLPWSFLRLPPLPPAAGQVQGINSVVGHFCEQAAAGSGPAKRVRLFGVNLEYCCSESAGIKETTPAGLRLPAASMIRDKSPRL